MACQACGTRMVVKTLDDAEVWATSHWLPYLVGWLYLGSSAVRFIGVDTS